MERCCGWEEGERRESGCKIKVEWNPRNERVVLANVLQQWGRVAL